MTAREVAAVLRADGWLLVRTKGLARAVPPPDQARSGDGPDASRRLADRHAQEHREGGRFQVAEMTMRYPAVVTKKCKNLRAGFPTCPRCHIFAPHGWDVRHRSEVD